MKTDSLNKYNKYSKNRYWLNNKNLYIFSLLASAMLLTGCSSYKATDSIPETTEQQITGESISVTCETKPGEDSSTYKFKSEQVDLPAELSDIDSVSVFNNRVCCSGPEKKLYEVYNISAVSRDGSEKAMPFTLELPEIIIDNSPVKVYPVINDSFCEGEFLYITGIVSDVFEQETVSFIVRYSISEEKTVNTVYTDAGNSFGSITFDREDNALYALDKSGKIYKYTDSLEYVSQYDIVGQGDAQFPILYHCSEIRTDSDGIYVLAADTVSFKTTSYFNSYSLLRYTRDFELKYISKINPPDYNNEIAGTIHRICGLNVLNAGGAAVFYTRYMEDAASLYDDSELWADIYTDDSGSFRSVNLNTDSITENTGQSQYDYVTINRGDDYLEYQFRNIGDDEIKDVFRIAHHQPGGITPVLYDETAIYNPECFGSDKKFSFTGSV